ncbi:MAG: pyridoxamine 5'-phosphate oxidase family protein [Gemmatimonadota bacterium]
MDSINQQQPEDNRDDLVGDAAVKKIRELVKEAQTCFFCTAIPSGESSAARPMNVREVDEEGNLWFLSANDSHKNAELALDPTVKLYMQGSPHSEFLSLTGHAMITTDHERIKELWTPVVRTWFTGGVDDPRITAIKVTPTDGYYWDNKHGNAIAGIKMLIGAAIRKTLDDSVEGTLGV